MPKPGRVVGTLRGWGESVNRAKLKMHVFCGAGPPRRKTVWMLAVGGTGNHPLGIKRKSRVMMGRVETTQAAARCGTIFEKSKVEMIHRRGGEAQPLPHLPERPCRAAIAGSLLEFPQLHSSDRSASVSSCVLPEPRFAGSSLIR